MEPFGKYAHIRRHGAAGSNTLILFSMRGNKTPQREQWKKKKKSKTSMWPVGDTEIRKRGRDAERWKQVESREHRRPELKGKKVKAGKRMAELRVYNGHVACDSCDSMQGLTRSARGTDGPTQQYLCTHVCAFILHASLSIICLFTCSPRKVMWKPLIW